jgi:phage FluMu protein Com
MTIEFHCPHCDKLLKTADDKAGVKANCPGCGEAVTIPDAAHETAGPDASLAVENEPARPLPEPTTRAPDPEAVLTGPADLPGETKNCPMCGAAVKKAAKRCRFCGENFVHEQVPGVPTPIEAGEVLSLAWELFKKNFGMLLAAFLIMVGIAFAVNMVGQFVQFIIMISIVGFKGGAAPINDPSQLIAIYVPAIFFGIVNFAVNCYLQAGLNRLLLKVARGEKAEISDVFSGRRYFWRFVWANVLFTLMFYVGLVLLLIPGVFVALMFWPAMYLIVDRDVAVIESFRESLALSSGNYMACFVLGLAAIGAQIAGLCACCVGVFASTPFVMLLFAVAYCRMNGEAVAAS